MPVVICNNLYSMSARIVRHYCKHCDADPFDDKLQYRRHLSHNHFICPYDECYRRFGSRDDLIQRWIITQHSFYCHTCKGGLDTVNELRKHYCVPPSVGIECEVCRMVAPNKEAYERHWEDTAGDDRHIRCSECCKIFHGSNELRQVRLYSLSPFIDGPISCNTPYCCKCQFLQTFSHEFTAHANPPQSSVWVCLLREHVSLVLRHVPSCRNWVL